MSCEKSRNTEAAETKRVFIQVYYSSLRLASRFSAQFKIHKHSSKSERPQ